MAEENKYLTNEEIDEFTSKYKGDVRVNRDILDRMKNTIEKLEAEYTSVKSLKSFITTGVLVSPNLILSADPDKHGINLGMRLTAFSEIRMTEELSAVSTSLRVQDVERLIRMLPELLKSARLHRKFRALKDLYKDKKDTSRYRRF